MFGVAKLDFSKGLQISMVLKYFPRIFSTYTLIYIS